MRWNRPRPRPRAASRLHPEGGDRAHPRAGLGLALEIARHDRVPQDHDGLVVEVVDLRSRVGAQAVPLAAVPVRGDLHAGTTSRTGSASMLRVMLLGTRTSSPTTRRWTRPASASMTAC